MLFRSEAVQIPEWQAAMSDELAALERTSTWNLVPLHPGVVPITCKWVYKVKTCFDDSVKRYKARLVAWASSRSIVGTMMRLLLMWRT